MFSSLEDFRYVRWVKRLNRTTQVLLSLTLVAGLNYVAARHFHRWDLTPNHRYSLSAETLARLAQNVPRTPNAPLQLILVAKQSQQSDDQRIMNDQIWTLMTEYRDSAKSETGANVLTIEKVDPDQQTTRTNQLAQYSPQGFDGSTLPQVIVLRKDTDGDHVRVLGPNDLFHLVSDKGDIAIKDFRGENAITSAILDVVEKKPDKIYFTTGHGELLMGDVNPHGLSRFGDMLTQRNYKLAPLDLSGSDDIPADATVVVIAHPISAFLPQEVEKIRRYLDQRNGRVLVFMEPSKAAPGASPTNGLEGLLHEWGLESPNLLVSEQDPSHVSNSLPKMNPIEYPARMHHKITESVAVTMQSVLLGPPRPVEIDMSASDDVRHQVHELLATSNNSYAVAPDATSIDPTKDIKGPITVAAISERRDSNSVDQPGGRLLVFGNVDVATNQFFGMLGNSMLLLNSVNYLADHETMLNIRPQLPKADSLGISTAQLNGLGWRLAMLPAAMAAFGLLACWVRSRA